MKNVGTIDQFIIQFHRILSSSKSKTEFFCILLYDLSVDSHPKVTTFQAAIWKPKRNMHALCKCGLGHYPLSTYNKSETERTFFFRLT